MGYSQSLWPRSFLTMMWQRSISASPRDSGGPMHGATHPALPRWGQSCGRGLCLEQGKPDDLNVHASAWSVREWMSVCLWSGTEEVLELITDFYRTSFACQHLYAHHSHNTLNIHAPMLIFTCTYIVWMFGGRDWPTPCLV